MKTKNQKIITLIEKIINQDENKKFYADLDTLLLKKCFDNIYELSLSENIIRINSANLSCRDILKILNDFFDSVESKRIYNSRELFEVVKLSSLSEKKLNRALNSDIYLKIADFLNIVSCETSYISQQFLILRSCDNFFVKNENNPIVIAAYQKLMKKVINKIVSTNFLEEKKLKETTILCWIDRILTAVLCKDISIDDFILVCDKILSLTIYSIYLYWKILNSANYLLLQQDFSASKKLRQYKNSIEKIINQKYLNAKFSQEELQNLFISTVAKQKVQKEDYYYLFDAITITASSTQNDKLFCLNLYEYLITYNSKFKVFNYRFIRKYFIDALFSIINKQDTITVQNKELQILIMLINMDVFFCFEKHRLFFTYINILRSIVFNGNNLNHNNFYKYCDILDYFLTINPDFTFPNIIEYLSTSYNKQKISRHFTLIKEKHI